MSVAKEFIRTVTPPTGWITVIAIHPETENIVGRSLSAEQPDRADDFIDKHPKWNLYWSPNPQEKRLDKKPLKADTSRIDWLFVDIDDPSEAALDRLRKYRIAPTLIIFSGGGYQGFWKLDPPASIADMETVEACNRQLIIDLNGDKSAWNIDRIMRLPGTTNWPTKTKLERGRVPAKARILK